jgi:hypothetical protein
VEIDREGLSRSSTIWRRWLRGGLPHTLGTHRCQAVEIDREGL